MAMAVELRTESFKGFKSIVFNSYVVGDECIGSAGLSEAQIA